MPSMVHAPYPLIITGPEKIIIGLSAGKDERDAMIFRAPLTEKA